MNILVTGGTGFIGQALVPRLLAEGHKLTLFTRRPDFVKSHLPQVDAISSWQALQACPRALINLAGEGIADKRWSANRKQQLWDSRVTLTESLVKYFQQQHWVPETILSGSAVGFYGNTGDQKVDEHSACGQDFSAHLCHSWESAIMPLQQAGSRVCWLRTGIVLGQGGFLSRLKLPFSLGMGGRLGKGQQFMSWIHIDDWVNMVVRLLSDVQLQGPVNLCSDQSVTNAEFTRDLSRQLSRPAFLHQPAWVLRLIFGELSELLLGGQRVKPTVMIEADYHFQKPNLHQALAAVFEVENG